MILTGLCSHVDLYRNFDLHSNEMMAFSISVRKLFVRMYFSSPASINFLVLLASSTSLKRGDDDAESDSYKISMSKYIVTPIAVVNAIKAQTITSKNDKRGNI